MRFHGHELESKVKGREGMRSRAIIPSLNCISRLQLMRQQQITLNRKRTDSGVVRRSSFEMDCWDASFHNEEMFFELWMLSWAGAMLFISKMKNARRFSALWVVTACMAGLFNEILVLGSFRVQRVLVAWVDKPTVVNIHHNAWLQFVCFSPLRI